MTFKINTETKTILIVGSYKHEDMVKAQEILDYYKGYTILNETPIETFNNASEAVDMAVYGNAFKIKNADGSMERINPTQVERPPYGKGQ